LAIVAPLRFGAVAGASQGGGPVPIALRFNGSKARVNWK